MTAPYSHPGSAEVYDAVYDPLRDYRTDAAKVVDIVRASTGASDLSGLALLDAGCGTGRHLEHLGSEFGEAAGLDSSEVQIAAARARLGDGYALHVADIRELDGLFESERFDVIVSLFSVVSCLEDEAELVAAIRGLGRTLRPGGVLLVEPWLQPDAYRPLPLLVYTVNQPELKVSRMCLPVRDGDHVTLTMHHLVGRPAGIDQYVEEHRMRLFAERDMLDAFGAAGLDARFDPEGFDDVGRGVWIATKAGGTAGGRSG